MGDDVQGAIEIDITEELSDETIQALFDGFAAEDWAAVDAAIDGIDSEILVAAEEKAGGADKNRGNAEVLRRYWTVGKGAGKIRWQQEGDWTRCVEHLSKYLGDRAKGWCNLRHKEMDGFYPGDRRNLTKSAAGSDGVAGSSVVFGLGDSLKVGGVHAQSNSADMVDMQPVRYGPVGDGVRESVGGDRLAPSSLDHSVTTTAYSSHKQPAAVGTMREGVKSFGGSSTGDTYLGTTYTPSSTKAGSMGTTEADVVGGSVASWDGTSHVKNVGVPVIEHKNVGVTGLKVLSAEDGIVESFISVTGIVDEVKDRIIPGAYSKTLARRKPKGVWSHDWDTPVSRTLDVKELMPGDPSLPSRMPNGDPWPPEAGALMVKTQFNLDTQRGREAYSDVVFFGDEQEWSIGYNVPVGGARIDQKSGVREISTLDLYEYSPVLFGAMPLARTTSVKEAQLAFKAFRGAATADPETLDVSDDEWIEEQKSAQVIPADRMDLVQRAISVLTELLSVSQGDTPPSEETVEKKAASSEDDEMMDEDPSSEDEAGEDGGEYVTDLVGAVEAYCMDVMSSDSYDELESLANDVDSALDSDDADSLSATVDAFLDYVEKSISESDDPDVKTALRYVASALADFMGGSDNAEATETAGESTEPVAESGEPSNEQKTLLMDTTGAVIVDTSLLNELRSVLD